MFGNKFTDLIKGIEHWGINGFRTSGANVL